MAPEQYRGGAFLATDLYSLGCTLLFLLTSQSPADLPEKKLKIDFRNSVNIKQDFANWIDKLIEPDVNHRFSNAETALSVLEEKEDINNYQNNIILRPKYSKVSLTKLKEKLIIALPPPYKQEKRNFFYYLILFWIIISILNRLALFVTVNLFGKALIGNWIYATFIRRKNILLIIPKLYMLVYSVLLLFFSQNIPRLSIVILIIDVILESISKYIKYDFIRQLLVTTKITFHSPQNSEITIARKNFKSWQKNTIKYENFNFDTFLTNAEKKWLQKEIKQYLSLNN